jgi:hypothetical protein
VLGGVSPKREGPLNAWVKGEFDPNAARFAGEEMTLRPLAEELWGEFHNNAKPTGDAFVQYIQSFLSLDSKIENVLGRCETHPDDARRRQVFDDQRCRSCATASRSDDDLMLLNGCERNEPAPVHRARQAFEGEFCKLREVFAHHRTARTTITLSSVIGRFLCLCAVRQFPLHRWARLPIDGGQD